MNQFSKKQYPLEERTAQFGEKIIQLCSSLPQTHITQPITSQLIRSGTSIGANYCEANNASSRKDFKNKIYICKKESQETQFWLRMLLKHLPNSKNLIENLFDEARQLTLIFQKIIFTMTNKKSETNRTN